MTKEGHNRTKFAVWRPLALLQQLMYEKGWNVVHTTHTQQRLFCWVQKLLDFVWTAIGLIKKSNCAPLFLLNSSTTSEREREREREKEQEPPKLGCVLWSCLWQKTTHQTFNSCMPAIAMTFPPLQVAFVSFLLSLSLSLSRVVCASLYWNFNLFSSVIWVSGKI